jgi:hypothetical protein
MANEVLNVAENEIKEILVIDSEVVKCQGLQLCYPDEFFETIEQCKLCGKCV